MINLNNLCYGYYSDDDVLSNVTYQFNKGELYLITGENGVGKTTFIKLLLGLLRPKLGNVYFDKREKVAYLPDYNGIYEDLTIEENVIFRLSLYNIKFLEKKKLFYNLLEKYSLLEKKDCAIKSLSLGMKKKVGIICTILCDASIYIFDEPTGGLDHESTTDVLNMLNGLKSNDVLVICISHENQLGERLNAIKIRMRNGGLE